MSEYTDDISDLAAHIIHKYDLSDTRLQLLVDELQCEINKRAKERLKNG